MLLKVLCSDKKALATKKRQTIGPQALLQNWVTTYHTMNLCPVKNRPGRNIACVFLYQHL